MIDRYFQSNYSILTNALNSGNISSMQNMHFFNMLHTKYIILDLNSSGVVGKPSQKPEEKPGVLPNPFALGNAWTVNNIRWVNNADEEIATFEEPDFNPKNTAVIDVRYKELVNESLDLSGGTLKLLEYQPNYLKYASSSDGDALAVFSEIFYDKGWKAFINGKEVPHFRVNYILRGLVIPSGDNEIEFKFDLPIYNQASLISTISSSIIILLFLLFILFKILDKEFPVI